MKVTFLTESGQGIGLGHITRVNAISDFLLNKEIETKIYNYIKDSEETNWIRTINNIADIQNSDVVFIDSYLLDEEKFVLVSQINPNLIVLDDFNRLNYPPCILINPNVFFDRIDYSGQNAECKGGADFVIIREKFRAAKFLNNYNRGQILISIGGSDYRNLLPILVKLSEKWKNLHIVCPEEVKRKEIIEQFPLIKIYGKQNEEQMLSLIQSSEIVVSGCGQTLHELYYLNKKCIGILIDSDQILNQEYYFGKNFLKEKFSWSDENLLSSLSRTINSMISKDESGIQISSDISLFDPNKNMENYLKVILRFA